MVDQLKETVVVVGDRPGAPNTGLPPEAGQTNRLRTDPRRQFVAAGGWQWYANYARTLSFAIDDVTSDFGSDLYERMYRHPHIAGLVDGFRAAILEDGLQLRPAVENEDEDGYDIAKRLVDEYARVLDDMDPGTDAALWDMTSACYLGNKVGEITYDDQVAGGKPKLYPVKFKCKPRQSTAFVVNTFNDVLGLLGRVPGVGQPVYVGTLLVQPDESPNLIPRNKFVVLSWRMVDGDPRGTSMLRPLYDPWFRLIQIQVEELKFLARFGSPGLVGTTGPDAEAGWDEDDDGNPNLPQLTPEQQLVAMLELWQNGAAIAVPNGTEVEAFWPTLGRQSPFQSAKDDIKRDMTYSFTSQTMATEEPRFGTKAGQGVHQDTYDTLVRQGKRGVERAFYRDLLRQMVLWNEGEKYLPLCPKATLGVQEAHDAADDLTALGTVYSSGFVSESQKPGLDKKYGMPQRDPVEDARIEAEKQQQAQAEAQQAFERQKALAEARGPMQLGPGQQPSKPQQQPAGQNGRQPAGVAK